MLQWLRRLCKPLYRIWFLWTLLKQDWCSPIIQSLTRPSSTFTLRDLKEFTLVNGNLYFWTSGEVLAWAISKAEAKEELQRVHDLSCAGNYISLYRACKRKVIVSLRWPRKQLTSERFCKVPGVPRCRRILVPLRGRRLETTILDFYHYHLLPPNWSDDEDSKEVV